ncbi:MAG: gamma-glutamyltransferase [Verrucomicrobia bacterium]|nr:gamma-glutamyltransferase [Verrucomicrobiota bacterium]
MIPPLPQGEGRGEGGTCRITRLTGFFVALLSVSLCSTALANSAIADKGMAATVNPIATEAAANAMKRGGNAVDAAVAAALTLGVVDGHNSGVGGGCFMLIRLPIGKYVAIDAREMAGAAATRDMFIRDGQADTALSQTGPLASGVPGSLAAYTYALKEFGKLKLADHLRAAADIAETGFTIDEVYARKLKGAAADLAKFPASKAIFLHKDGSPYIKGEIIKQPDLAKSYRAMAKDGIRWFYDGPFSQAAAKWMKENGGILTEQDFRTYRLELREPIFTTYRGYRIASFPPPSSGGVHVAEILNILETRDVKAMGAGSADFIHFTTEAMKLAFADRAHWLGDPDFARVPRGLVSKEYATNLAAKISMTHATPVPQHGTPEKAHDDIFGKHTTHFSTADADGNWVACTATVNTAFGSKVVIPGTGIVLNNQMDDFSVQPGVPNAFKLVGAEANAVAPGKRPLSSMSPTIATKDGRPILSIGAAGGPTIITQTLLALVNILDFGMDLEGALTAPRFHHQWNPDELKIEKSVGDAVLAELEKRGHKLDQSSGFGACNGVLLNRSGDKFTGVNDPRVPGAAKGVSGK